MSRGDTATIRGFTLMELIIAISLAAVLLTLIGTAINLYLVHVDKGRSQVEEAQLARSILAMIADDLRNTSIYQPQDTSSIASLMAKVSYDVDSIDDPASSGSGTPSKLAAMAAIAQASKSGSGSTGSTSGSSSGSTGSASGSGSSSSGTSGDGTATTDNTLPLGLNGQLEEIYIDSTRLPKQEELFNTTTGYTNAQSPTAGSGGAAGAGSLTNGGGAASASAGIPPADLKNIHYFVRPGDAVEVGSASVTSLDPEAQQHLGGLVRQEIPRAARHFAETNGGDQVLNSGQKLIAPEVVHAEFRYYDGSNINEDWDMNEKKTLPIAVEITIWLRTAGASDQPVAASPATADLSNTHQYRQVVYLPMAAVASSNQSSSSSDSSTDSNSTDNSTTDESSSGASSGFGTTQQ